MTSQTRRDTKIDLCVACADENDLVEGVELAMTNPRIGPIHTICVQARQRAAQTGKCRCGADKRRPDDVKAPFGPRGRAWIPCLRCLGTIRQVR